MKKITAGLGVVQLALACCAFAATTSDSQYPSRPVRVIVPYPAGGSLDLIGRVYAKAIGDSLGQTFVVDNRGGANGNIGTEAVANATPDGYTLVVTSSSNLTINPNIYRKMPFDVSRDLAPVSLVAVQRNVLVVNPSLPVHTVKELVALAKAKPAAINVASAGTGTITHLSGELFRSIVNVTWTHVPYKGAPPAMTDLASGQVQVMFSSLPAAMAFVRSNRVRPIAVSSKSRADTLPDVPTVIESGIPGYEVEYWYGIFAPAATPRDVVTKLGDEIAQAIRQPDTVTNLANQGASPGRLTQAQFADFVKAEVSKWGNVVRLSGARAD